MFYIGAHIPRENNLLNTMNKIIESGGNSLQIFASNPKSIKVANYNHKFLGNPEDIFSFIQKNNFKLVIHSPYTINLSSSLIINKRLITINECYWIQILLNELEIAHKIGAIGCIVHTGKFTKNSINDSLLNMKTCIQFILHEIHRNKWNSKLILETPSGQGTELLSNYQDFLNFYNSFNLMEKKVFKICIDTCHIWASGYELNDIFNITIKNNNLFDITFIHLNNSKNPKGSNLDRHDIINKGYINIQDIYTFIKNFNKNNNNIIIILETPSSNLNLEIHQIKNNI